MESVFYLMWLADIACSIATAGVICLCGFVLCFVIYGFMLIDGVGDDIPMILKHHKWLLAPVVLACIFPSASSIRVLAAAKAGEIAISTPIGEKSLRAIEAVLDKVIEKKN